MSESVNLNGTSQTTVEDPNQSGEPSSKNIESRITSSSSHCIICSAAHSPSDSYWKDTSGFVQHQFLKQFQSGELAVFQDTTRQVKCSGFYGLQLRSHCNSAGVTKTTIITSLYSGHRVNRNCTMYIVHTAEDSTGLLTV